MITDLLKILLSITLSIPIGLEREKQDKPAGLRTIMLVCLGTTVFTLLGNQFKGIQNFDGLRLVYAAIVGIGFLGSGTIIKREADIEGITTASTLWAIVALGILIGFGYYLLAIIVSILIYLMLKIKRLFPDK